MPTKINDININNNNNNSYNNIIEAKRFYIISQLLVLTTELTELIATTDAFQYAFKYSKIVDYSDKKFNCSMAKAAHTMFHMTPPSQQQLLFKKINELKEKIDMLNEELKQSEQLQLQQQSEYVEEVGEKKFTLSQTLQLQQLQPKYLIADKK